MSSQYAVVGCDRCHSHQVVEAEQRLIQQTIHCRNCGKRHEAGSLRAKAQHETREGAEELRSRILASRAGEIDRYQQEDDYAELADRVDQEIENSVLDAEKMDLTPIGSDLGEEEANLGFTEDWFHTPDANPGLFDDVMADEVELDNDWPASLGEAEVQDSLQEWRDSIDDSQLVTQHTGELVLDRQRPADTIANLELNEGTTVARSGHDAGIWATLLTEPDVQQALINGIRRLAEGYESHELWSILEARNIPRDIHGPIVRLARGTDRDDTQDTTVTEQTVRRLLFGDAGEPGILYRLRRLGTQRESIEEIFAVAQLVGFTTDTDSTPPTIAFSFDESFREKKAKKRNRVLRLCYQLARHCEVVITGKPIDLRWVSVSHDIDRSAFNERWVGRGHSVEIDDRANEAVTHLDTNSTGAQILRHLHTDVYETRRYADLEDALDVSTATISNWVVRNDHSLTELGLVETFEGGDGSMYVELQPAGSAAIELIDSETTRQQRLDELFNSPLQSSDHGRVVPHEHEGGGTDDPRRKGDGLAPVKELPRSRAYGAKAASPENGVSTVDSPVEVSDDYRCPSLYAESGLAVVSAEYCNPMQYWVSIARSLTHPRLFARTLTEDRLESSNQDFAELFADHRQLLRSTRCLGYLADEIENAAGYIRALQDARDDLEDLTRDLQKGDFEDEAALRGDITGNALGLVGTVIHTMDLVDVDLVREFRLPKFSSDFDQDRWEDLVETLAISTAIHSKYEQFSVYRQLFERREEKLDWTTFADVDATDPVGELIGSTVLVGNFGDPDGEKRATFVEDLTAALSDQQPRDDAPEFGVEVPIRCFETDRSSIAEATSLMLGSKNLRPSRDAVSLLQLMVGTPYDVTKALHWLERNDTKREVRLDEIRYALSKLPSDRIVPLLRSGAGNIVKALLEVDQPLSTTELTDRAGIARSTLTRSGSAPGDRLQALGLVAQTDEGWRLMLPFRTDEERYEEIVPRVLDDGEPVVQYPRDELWEVAETLGDLGDQSLIRRWPSELTASGVPDLEQLLSAELWLRQWVSMCEEILNRQEAGYDSGDSSIVASFGSVEIEQVPLGDGFESEVAI